jgi:hypothetical protein
MSASGAARSGNGAIARWSRLGLARVREHRHHDELPVLLPRHERHRRCAHDVRDRRQLLGGGVGRRHADALHRCHPPAPRPGPEPRQYPGSWSAAVRLAVPSTPTEPDGRLPNGRDDAIERAPIGRRAYASARRRSPGAQMRTRSSSSSDVTPVRALARPSSQSVLIPPLFAARSSSSRLAYLAARCSSASLILMSWKIPTRPL